MCTVTFVPIGAHSYILTHNRDEKTSRPAAIFPSKVSLQSCDLFYPTDPQGKGTWIATSSCRFSLCLLNGGYNIHNPKDSYPESRGNIILDFFAFESLQHFIKNNNWHNFDAFTLIIVENFSTEIIYLHELVWDESILHYKQLDAQLPYIWSSSTLYTPIQKLERKNWFTSFLVENVNPTTEQILQFHLFSPENKEGFIIDRKDSGRKTVSLTQIVNQRNESCQLFYKDLVSDKQEQLVIFK